jgi:hypothetical protein
MPPPPLRTGLAAFTASGSSISNALVLKEGRYIAGCYPVGQGGLCRQFDEEWRGYRAEPSGHRKRLARE